MCTHVNTHTRAVYINVRGCVCTCMSACVHMVACEKVSMRAGWGLLGHVLQKKAGPHVLSLRLNRTELYIFAHLACGRLPRRGQLNKGTPKPLVKSPFVWPSAPVHLSPVNSISLHLDFLCLALLAPNWGLCDMCYQDLLHSVLRMFYFPQSPASRAPGNNVQPTSGLPDSPFIGTGPSGDVRPTLRAISKSRGHSRPMGDLTVSGCSQVLKGHVPVIWEAQPSCYLSLSSPPFSNCIS